MKKRIAQYLLGIIIICYGVASIISARIGTSAADAINTNVSYLTPLTVGQSIGIMSVVFVLLSLLFKRKLIILVSLVFVFILTPGIDFFFYKVIEVYYPTDLWFRILNFAIGVLLVNLGTSLTIVSKLPLTPYDQFTMMMVELTKKPLIVIRFSLEFTLLIIGVILGIRSGYLNETVSIGTVIFALSGAPLIRLFVFLLNGGKKHVNQQTN
ncbi:MAG TPA: hypothetical protein PLR26_04455 [Bacilli bacterium]|nr:hypothetical protein [Bacilli bacterium]